jgi:LysR family D-serine deaminase transcriptional activator
MGRVFLIRNLLDAGQLVTPFKQQLKGPTKYCLLYPKELANRPGMQAVIEWLHQQADG